MPEIIRRKRALSVNLLKASQPAGASLATLGFARSIPMLHGSQDCTAVGKVDFVRHVRQPLSLPSSSTDQVNSGVGGDDPFTQGVATIAEKSPPELITVLRTHRSEALGTDIEHCVHEFRRRYPEFAKAAVVAVNTPDFTGCLETGYAATVTEIIDQLVPAATEAGTRPGIRLRQLNVLAASMLTPGDLEHLRDIIASFGLRAVFVPDLSDPQERRLVGAELSPGSLGGTPVDELATLGNAVATLAVGPSLRKAADLLEARTGVPTHRLDHLYGLAANDALMVALQRIARTKKVPDHLVRQRAQLLEAMTGTHCVLGGRRVAVAADPDQLNGLCHFVEEMGGEVVAAAAAGDGPALATIPVEPRQIGGLDDLEALAREHAAELLIGNAHAVSSAERLGLPILRCGFPLHDIVGGDRSTSIGYAGGRQMLLDLAQQPLAHNHAQSAAPYRSIHSQSPANALTATYWRNPSMARIPHLPLADSNPDDSLMQTSLKLAFATDDVRQVNQHFNSAKTFAVYAVEPDHAELLEAAEFGKLAQDDIEDPLAAMIQQLAGCAVVYCEAIGTSATQQLMARGIQPVKVSRGAQIAHLIDDFQNEMKSGASVWVSKASARRAAMDQSAFTRNPSEGRDA